MKHPLSLLFRSCSRISWLLQILILVVLTSALPSAAQAIGSAQPPAEVDPFQSSDGKITVLLFVRTDCPISNRYAPLIQQLATKYTSQAKFWLVYPERTESPSAIRTHDATFGYKLAVLRDPRRILVQKSHATTTPEAAVFNAGGQLIYHGRIDDWYFAFGKHRAAATTHELSDAISAAISHKPVSVSSSTAVGCYISDLP